MATPVEENKPLAPLHTFGLKASAAYYIEVRREEDLTEILQLPYRPKLILGGGSNLFFAKDYPGLIIKNSILGIRIEQEDEEDVILEIGGGVIWHDLVLWTIGRNLGGLENLSLIPGTVGAAPIQNIGAYGVEFDSVFQQLTAYRIETGEKMIFNKADCKFGYRDSIFKRDLKDQLIVTHVQVRLKKKNHKLALDYGDIRQILDQKQITHPTIRDVSDAVIAIRTSKLPDPVKLGNAGSFFKNPVVREDLYVGLLSQYPDMPGFSNGKGETKIPAAWLIEQAGWKGYRDGDAGVYQRHALVLVNHGKATGPEMFRLASAIKSSVLDIFGISLEFEVNMI